MDPKELIKLAAACRKAGIRKYKADGIEFELSDESPFKSRRKRSKQAQDESDGAPEMANGWDKLTPEQQLLWSASGHDPAEAKEGAQ